MATLSFRCWASIRHAPPKKRNQVNGTPWVIAHTHGGVDGIRVVAAVLIMASRTVVPVFTSSSVGLVAVHVGIDTVTVVPDRRVVLGAVEVRRERGDHGRMVGLGQHLLHDGFSFGHSGKPGPFLPIPRASDDTLEGVPGFAEAGDDSIRQTAPACKRHTRAHPTKDNQDISMLRCKVQCTRPNVRPYSIGTDRQAGTPGRRSPSCRKPPRGPRYRWQPAAERAHTRAVMCKWS